MSEKQNAPFVGPPAPEPEKEGWFGRNWRKTKENISSAYNATAEGAIKAKRQLSSAIGQIVYSDEKLFQWALKNPEEQNEGFRGSMLQDRPAVQTAIELCKRYPDIFKPKISREVVGPPTATPEMEFVRIQEISEVVVGNFEAFERWLAKIQKLPLDRRKLHLQVIHADPSPTKSEQLFRKQEDIDLYFELAAIGTGKSTEWVPNKLVHEAAVRFNELYATGPDVDGTKDQIAAAKKMPTPFIIGIMVKNASMLNASNRELTAELVRRNSDEFLDALSSLDGDHQKTFVKLMLNRSRLHELSKPMDETQCMRFIDVIDAALDTLDTDEMKHLTHAPGLEPAIRDAKLGKGFFEVLLKNMEKAGGDAEKLQYAVLVKFEDAARRFSITFDETKLKEIREELDSFARYDTKEALEDGVFTVVSLFTADLKLFGNARPKGLRAMQNSDFLQSERELQRNGYKITARQGVVSVTLEKNIGGKKIVHRLIKTGEDYASMHDALADPSVDMIVQRGHCWDAEESFLGNAQKLDEKDAVDREKHEASHKKIVLVGGCFQARELEHYRENIKGEEPFFIATSKTGKGGITLPISYTYAEEVVRAAEKAPNPVIDLQQVDASVRQRAKTPLTRIAEADGYVFPTAAPAMIEKLVPS